MRYIKSMATRRSLLARFAFLAVAVSCGGGGTDVPPVGTVNVTPVSASIDVGATLQLTAATVGANGSVLTGRAITWSSSDITKATVSSSGLVTGVAPGTAAITATSEGKAGGAAITVKAGALGSCAAASALKLAAGEIRSLSASEAASLCLGGIAGASEYVLIPFNNSTVAATTTPFTLESTYTVAVTTVPAPPAALDVGSLRLRATPMLDTRAGESLLRDRELAAIPTPRSRPRVSRQRTHAIPGHLSVGDIITLNSNISGDICRATRADHPARLVASVGRTMVFLDTLSPKNGFTDDELIAFANQFDTLSIPLDEANFGGVTDIDENEHVVIFFTPGVNRLSAVPGAIVGGAFVPRDLFSSAPGDECEASNEGEIFYVPVPDPTSTINGNYTDKTRLAQIVPGTLAHELQHLINGARRVYINEARTFEERWLNEGLSHIAEELMYFRVSKKGPLTNLTINDIAANQPLVDAYNNILSGNFGRLASYMVAPSSSTPFTNVDGLEMRGAVWQLLRYAADLKGEPQSATWMALVNATSAGQTNFRNVFGDFIGLLRDFTVAQFADDLGFSTPPKYQYASWNFRNIYPRLSGNRFPLSTIQLIGGSQVPMQLVGGGTAYVRFRVAANTLAAIVASASGLPLPSNIDFVLMRTQ